MGLIPDEIIAQVLDRSDIVETISEYFPLKQTGRNFKANCPFHNEKTPSFVVSPDKQIFHCFGCGAGGNVIRFVMQQEHLEFPEAVRLLAQKTGVMIPETSSASEANTSLRQLTLRVNQLAVDFFHKNLLFAKESAAKDAVVYLKERQLNLATVKQMKLGFALNEWDGLLKYLEKQGISPQVMEKAGLVLPRKNQDGFYDRFRNRIVFPIFDIKSQCVAFGARSMEKEATAKYINSPETSIYTKGRHLYGFHLAKNAVAQEDLVIITEGYMDFIMPFQFGVKNLVASLGTALTVDQIRLLRRYTKNVIMLFDTDTAGESAMVRSLDLLIEEDMNVKVATLTEGQDPDSFLRAHGAEHFLKRVHQAQSLFDYKFESLKKQYHSKSIEDRAQLAQKMLDTIKRFPNKIIQSGYLKQLAQNLNISEESLLAEHNKILDHRTFPKDRVPAKEVQPFQEGSSMLEEQLLKLLLECHDLISTSRNDLELSDFYDGKIRTVIEKIFELDAQGQPIHVGALLNHFNDKEIQSWLSHLMASEQISGDPKKIYRDFINRMKQNRLKSKRKYLRSQIQEAEESGDQITLNRLKEQFNQLIKG